jgi:hypothetical protein
MRKGSRSDLRYLGVVDLDDRLLQLLDASALEIELTGMVLGHPVAVTENVFAFALNAQ